jgi:hypothetical protein
MEPASPRALMEAQEATAIAIITATTPHAGMRIG